MPCANTLAKLLHGLDADRLDAPFGGWLAGGQRSFANAESLMKELCGWHVSDERFR